MNNPRLTAGLVATMVAFGCGDSTGTQIDHFPKEWSSAIIVVDTVDASASGTLRGVVLDSGNALAPTPDVGALVQLTTAFTPSERGHASSTAAALLGQVVTDANGRFLIIHIPAGSFYIEATPADSTLPNGATFRFSSTGADEKNDTVWIARTAH